MKSLAILLLAAVIAMGIYGAHSVRSTVRAAIQTRVVRVEQ